jgi:hypothetical protein
MRWLASGPSCGTVAAQAARTLSQHSACVCAAATCADLPPNQLPPPHTSTRYSYGTRALDQLRRYYEGQIADVMSDDEADGAAAPAGNRFSNGPAAAPQGALPRRPLSLRAAVAPPPLLPLLACSLPRQAPPAQVGPQPPAGCRPVHMRGTATPPRAVPWLPAASMGNAGMPSRHIPPLRQPRLPACCKHPALMPPLQLSWTESLARVPLPQRTRVLAFWPRSPLLPGYPQLPQPRSHSSHSCHSAHPPLPPCLCPRRQPARRGAQAAGGAAPPAGQPGRPPRRAPALPGGVLWADTAAAGLLAALRLPPGLPASDAQRRDRWGWFGATREESVQGGRRCASWAAVGDVGCSDLLTTR